MSLSDLEVLLIKTPQIIDNKEDFENFTSKLSQFTNKSGFVTIYDNNMSYAPEDLYRILRYLINMEVTKEMVDNAKNKKILILKSKNLEPNDLNMIVTKIDNVIKEYDLNILFLPEETELMNSDEFFNKISNELQRYEKLKEKIKHENRKTLENYSKQNPPKKKSD